MNMQDINFKRFQSGVALFKRSENEGVHQKMLKAKVQLISRLDFFGGIASLMELYPTDELPSFSGDYRFFYYNPEYYDKATLEQIQGDVLHALMHVVLKHFERMKGRVPEVWGLSTEVVTDLIVDDIVNQHKSLVDRDELIFAPEIQDVSNIPEEFRKKAVEKVYNKLIEAFDDAMNEQNSSSQGKSKKESEDGEGQSNREQAAETAEDASGVPSQCHINETQKRLEKLGESVARLEDERMENLMKSQYDKLDDSFKDRGFIPSELEEYIQNIDKDETVDWRKMLEKYLESNVVSDVSWNRPSKSFLANGMYFPGNFKSNLTVIVAIDTSGSVTNDELNEFVSEVQQIMRSFGKVRMVIIDCDAQVQNVQIIENGESVDDQPVPWEGRKWYGRGGTKFEPVFEWIEAAKNGFSVPMSDGNNDFVDLENMQCLVYFTDGWGSFPEEEPSAYQTIWVINDMNYPQDNVPFGEIIMYEREKEE